ncbi:MAG TPA: hypothetical protein VJN18_00960 [Polyangiaceae bacterium]|nr:hypothetical protein [Polyangiaceae bacterium]
MKQPTTGCKVITQYHSAGEMVYELASEEANLDIRVSSRTLESGERSWHVAAQPGRAPDAVQISDFAPTKADALGKVAVLWVERQAELGLPHFDWAAVAAALVAVRGI